MDTFELSRRIYESCDRIHQATADMYEAMHPNGEPHANRVITESNIKDFREWVNHEIDLIRELVSEYSGNYKL